MLISFLPHEPHKNISYIFLNHMVIGVTGQPAYKLLFTSSTVIVP